MFEHRQELMQNLLETNPNFKRIYETHQEYDRQIIDAETGVTWLSDMEFSKLKKQRLYAKDALARIMDSEAVH